MKSQTFIILKLGLFLSLLLLLGCSSGKYFDAPQSGEIPKGPGLFTKGDDGAVLFDSKGGGLIHSEAEKAPSSEAAAAEQTLEKTTQVQDFKDFEAFKQWQEWKRGATNSDEYKEFQDWQQWERYQEWKKSQ